MKTTILKQVRLLYSSTSYVNNSVTVRVFVCATYSLPGTPILSVVMWNQTLYDLLQMMIQLLLCRQQGEEPTKRHMESGTAGETSMPPLKCGCFSSAAYIATVHAACDRPRCLRVVNSGIHAPHPLDLRGVIIKPPNPPTILNSKHLKHLGPCRQRPLSSLE